MAAVALLVGAAPRFGRAREKVEAALGGLARTGITLLRLLGAVAVAADELAGAGGVGQRAERRRQRVATCRPPITSERAARASDPLSVEILADRLRQSPFELIMSSGFLVSLPTPAWCRRWRRRRCGRSWWAAHRRALVAGLWGAGLSAETIRDRLFTLKREDFGIRIRCSRCAVASCAARGFSRCSKKRWRRWAWFVPDQCATPVRVVVFDVATRRALAVSRGALATAIRASCSVPGMFSRRASTGASLSTAA